MQLTEFRDVLHGVVRIPPYLRPFLSIPEFVRLRGVRLSNVDSIEFKDFAAPSRWEHSVAVAALAYRCAQVRGMDRRDQVHLVLAALLHDVATPPFAHTAEYVLIDFNHEVETYNLLAGNRSLDAQTNLPVYLSELPRFVDVSKDVGQELGIKISPEEVAEMVVGSGPNGWLISGTLDLDNADNVLRACLHLGLEVDRSLPTRLTDWLAAQEDPPLELSAAEDEAVRQWLDYRTQLYGMFYESSDTELGRQAFLQHLMRRAIDEGFPRRWIVWNTDDGLFHRLEQYDGRQIGHADRPPYRLSMRQLVSQYRLLVEPTKLLEVPIVDQQSFEALSSPRFADWLERRLASDSFEPFVMVAARRGGSTDESGRLWSAEPGTLHVYHIGKKLAFASMPEWLQHDIAGNVDHAEADASSAIAKAILRRIPSWAAKRPWAEVAEREEPSVVEALEGVGDWSFRLTTNRNDVLHAYPSTFVHAIPAALVTALRVKGETVIDPFGGTGRTALETVKYGGAGISGDINSVATLVAETALTFLSRRSRSRLSELSFRDVDDANPIDVPEFPYRERWHHPDTLIELAKCRTIIDEWEHPDEQRFLKTAFSAALKLSTGRSKEGHGFFADNAALPRGVDRPPRREAIRYFLDRVSKNLVAVERTYFSIEREGRDPSYELGRARAVKLDATSAMPADYGVEEHSVAAVITSPPYLGVSDYSLGNRLSYYWLGLGTPDDELKLEFGARRKRFRKDKAAEEYLNGMDTFLCNARALVREDGFLAMVLGQPRSKSFRDIDVLTQVDSFAEKQSFRLIWSNVRPISWSRNFEYKSLTNERISVYRLSN